MNVENEWDRPYWNLWLDKLRNLPKCNWCGEDRKRLRAGFCDACKRTEKTLARAKERLRTEQAKATHHELFLLRHEVEIWEKAVELCKADGASRELILDSEDFGSADLEEWLSLMHLEVCGEPDFYRQKATELGWTFNTSQRQILAYFFWTAMLVKWKRHRRQMAASAAHRAKIRAAEDEAQDGDMQA